MEVVTLGAVRVDDAVELLLEPANLKTLARSHGAACFAVVGESAARGFYGRLIENSSAIDAATRDHIVFAVFYGDRAGITYRASISSRRCLARYRVQGLSISTDQDVFLDTKPDLRRIQPELDPRLAELLGYPRSEDNRLDRSAIGHGCRCLMERYSIAEKTLRCS